jgi:hypothetical protein
VKGLAVSQHRDQTRSQAVTDAERARARAIDAGRWFSGYLVVIGVLCAAQITLMETFFPDGFARAIVSAVWAACMFLIAWRAERRSVWPAGATRRMWIAAGTWYGLYLFVIGPIVRWQFEQALLPWILASMVMSLPFFIAAAWGRSQR